MLLDENVYYVRYGFDYDLYEAAVNDVSLIASVYNSFGLPLDIFSVKVG